jgi:hypothetical protein
MCAFKTAIRKLPCMHPARRWVTVSEMNSHLQASLHAALRMCYRARMYLRMKKSDITSDMVCPALAWQSFRTGQAKHPWGYE